MVTLIASVSFGSLALIAGPCGLNFVIVLLHRVSLRIRALPPKAERSKV